MAIKIVSDTDEALNIEINNGDLKALKEIVSKWRFKDKDSALRFAVAILSITDNGKLYQEKDGSKVPLEPVETLLADK